MRDAAEPRGDAGLIETEKNRRRLLETSNPDCYKSTHFVQYIETAAMNEYVCRLAKFRTIRERYWTRWDEPATSRVHDGSPLEKGFKTRTPIRLENIRTVGY